MIARPSAPMLSSGTYLRSIAHDMGQRLGCGAHLATLRRTSVAEFEIADAHSLENLESAARQGTAEDLFVHPRKLAPQLPCMTATDENVALIRTAARSIYRRCRGLRR